jgi:hypothetical protein
VDNGFPVERGEPVAVVFVDYPRESGVMCWDQQLVAQVFDGTLWPLPGAPLYQRVQRLGDVPDGRGAVVVVPARYHADGEQVAALNDDLARLAWCVVVLTSDEESTFPWQALSHPRMRLWVMTPRPDRHPAGRAIRYLGEGWQPGTPEALDGLDDPARERHVQAFFAGQVTHDRRRKMAAALGGDPRRVVHATDRFADGDQRGYLAGLASARFAPAPAGPATPDSFRLFEALEAGAVPVADDGCGAYDRAGFSGGYWPLLCGGAPPWPVVSDWAEVPARMEAWDAAWPRLAARCGAWWQAHKRGVAAGFADDVAVLSGGVPPAAGVSDLLTVVVTASPIPSHPATDVIEQTVGSVLAQPALAGCEVVVACDGVRPGCEHLAGAYDEHLRRLVGLCRRRWRALPLLADGWEHQALRLRAALARVRTPLVLVMEHDTPLVDWCGPTDWEGICRLVLGGGSVSETGVNVVRLLHEADVLDAHRHMTVDRLPVELDGVPVYRTVQWSQRPHVAATGWYAALLARYFGASSRTFVEDALHGAAHNAWIEGGRTLGAWRRFGLAVYAPATASKMRSTHLDGRAGDAKAPCVFAYDGPQPEWAPNPSRDE